MAVTDKIYPLPALRALALHTQGLSAPHGQTPAPAPGAIYDVIERLGCLQIDTLQMVARSHYLVLWSRLGSYDPADLDRLIYRDGERRLFEYWGHAASIIPLADYRYRLPHMRLFAENASRWWKRWLDEPGSDQVIEHVLARIRADGRLRAADFKHDGAQRGSWWDWKPAKRALEYLFRRGDLMIADRVNFQRVYDLRERVLPDWVDASAASKAESDRHHVEGALRALGVCRPLQAAEYAYLKRGTARPIVEGLIGEGVAVEVAGELAGGEVETLAVHRDNLPLLEQAADGALPARRTTFLSPFDSLFWARGRDEDLWGFRQVLEAYKPEKDRIWGYFCLPILHHDRLVGRFDPKLERKTGTLRLKALYLEPGVEPDEALIADVAGALGDFMAFHRAADLVIERSDPADFGERLLAVFA
jgi:uncharacterized protein YcaQ